MGSGGVAIAALPTVICLKVPFSDGLGGVYMDPLRCQRTRFDSQCFFVSTRSWFDVSHSLALCVPFQRDGHGGYGVHVSGED